MKTDEEIIKFGSEQRCRFLLEIPRKERIINIIADYLTIERWTGWPDPDIRSLGITFNGQPIEYAGRIRETVVFMCADKSCHTADTLPMEILEKILEHFITTEQEDRT